jgi:DNA-binding transcriptional MerR regulator
MGDGAGLRIGDAAALLGITPKAIRLYHRRGLLPEPERDESDYRRYRPADLVALARIVRLRHVGLSLREIAPLVGADDGGVALRRALQDLDEQLAIEIAERRRRRRLLAEIRDEQVTDPIAVSAPSLAEERLIARLRAALPEMSPDQEAFQRRLQRALAAFALPGTDAAALDQADAIADEVLAATGGHDALVERHRRLYALLDADPDDPRVAALAAEMRAVMRKATAAIGIADDARAARDIDPVDLQRWWAGTTAALETLPPAVRRVWELVFDELLTAFDHAEAQADGQ